MCKDVGRTVLAKRLRKKSTIPSPTPPLHLLKDWIRTSIASETGFTLSKDPSHRRKGDHSQRTAQCLPKCKDEFIQDKRSWDRSTPFEGIVLQSKIETSFR